VRGYGDLPAALGEPGLVEVPLSRPRNVDLHRELFARVSAVVAVAADRAGPPDVG
jgi:hypothetical protein